MPKYQGPNPNSGPYNVPAGANITGGAKYNRIVSASATFFATASNGGSVAISTLGGCTVTLIGGGTLTLPSNTITPVEISVYSITAGSAALYYR